MICSVGLRRSVVSVFVALIAFLALAAASAVAGTTVIVDNTDAGFTVVSGSWSTGTTASGKYGTNYGYAATANPANAEAQWQPSIPATGDYQVSVWYPAGSNRINNVQYKVYYNGGNQVVAVDQTINAGTWVLIGTFNFAAGSSVNGRVTITNQSTQSSRRVYADAVQFYKLNPVDLTMAVSPVGEGTTAPAVGGPYTYVEGTVVNITAMPSAGYVFSQWSVSAGSAVANPTSPSTTVTMDVSKTVTAVFAPAPPQFRAFWVDVFHPGLASTTDIDAMINYAVAGRYNAVVVEVLAYHDQLSSSHGAYWMSEIVARSSVVTPSFDPLAYIVQKAHDNGLEVHPWIVAFRASSGWPPQGNDYLAGLPEWLMVPRDFIGTVVPIGSTYTFDPGSPDVQEYLVSIVRELATHYEVDGIHWDYIRYTQTDAGYPSDNNYANSGLARFRRITGRTDVPPATGDAQWNDFRRQTVDELIRRVRAEIPTFNNPRQPLRHTASLIPWGDAPANNDFTNSSAYGLFQNWELWMRAGWLDGACPMFYYREHCTDQYQWFRNWVNAAIGWRYNRHMFLGQGNYMNGLANSITQMRYEYDHGANGTLSYSYYSTRTSETLCDGVDSTVNDFSWYTYVANNLFTYHSNPPSMPWRYPNTATEGTLYGRVTDSVTGNPIDDVPVTVGSLNPARTDGNGYYVVTLIPAGGSGTSYTVTATKAPWSSVHDNVQVVAGDVRREDLAIGPLQPPRITQQPVPAAACLGGTTAFSVTAASEGTLSYQWQKEGVDLSDGGHYSNVTTKTLTVSNADGGDIAGYRCVVSNAAGSVTSDPAALSIKPATAITQQPQPQSLRLHNPASFSVMAVGGGTIRYQWRKGGVSLANGPNIQGCQSATLSILSVGLTDIGSYDCVVTADCGTLTSNEASLSFSTAPADFDNDGDVDTADFGHIQMCLSGVGVPQDDPSCQDAKLDDDTDVDDSEVAILLRCMSGADTPASTTCAN